MQIRSASASLEVAAIAIAITLATGCGGGQGDPQTASPGDDAAARSDFIASAEEICRRGDEAIEADIAHRVGAPAVSSARAQDFLTSAGKSTSDEETEKFIVGTLVPMTRRQLAAIEALDAPGELTASVDGLLRKAKTGVRTLERDPSLLTSRGINPLIAFSREARALGAPRCGQIIAAEAGPGGSTGVAPPS